MKLTGMADPSNGHDAESQENIRARRAYEAAGFRAEGVARGCAFIGGAYRDGLMMALLRPEWEARRKPAPGSMS